MLLISHFNMDVAPIHLKYPPTLWRCICNFCLTSITSFERLSRAALVVVQAFQQSFACELITLSVSVRIWADFARSDWDLCMFRFEYSIQVSGVVILCKQKYVLWLSIAWKSKWLIFAPSAVHLDYIRIIVIFYSSVIINASRIIIQRVCEIVDSHGLFLHL